MGFGRPKVRIPYPSLRELGSNAVFSRCCGLTSGSRTNQDEKRFKLIFKIKITVNGCQTPDTPDEGDPDPEAKSRFWKSS
jgi:hypothetical protein